MICPPVWILESSKSRGMFWEWRYNIVDGSGSHEVVYVLLVSRSRGLFGGELEAA
jgi:hypothetical protein